MRLLLDTHAFIWWDDDLKYLSAKALAACQNTDNILLLSIASIWEMQIKTQLGKLSFSVPLRDKIQNQQSTNGLEILPITIEHIFTLEQLPDNHRDPFDRLLIAQCIHENIALITSDPQIVSYDLSIIW